MNIRLNENAAQGLIPSVETVMNSINSVCKKKGGMYSKYSCKKISWDDVQRSTTTDNGLSCWGANITDTYLTAKDGRELYTLRSDNWNEKLGIVATDQIAMVHGNQLTTGGEKKKLSPIT